MQIKRITTQILKSTNKRKIHKRSQENPTRCEITLQSRHQMSVQKETTILSTIIPAASTRNRTQHSCMAACPYKNRRHFKQIH